MLLFGRRSVACDVFVIFRVQSVKYCSAAHRRTARMARRRICVCVEVQVSTSSHRARFVHMRSAMPSSRCSFPVVGYRSRIMSHHPVNVRVAVLLLDRRRQRRCRRADGTTTTTARYRIGYCHCHRHCRCRRFDHPVIAAIAVVDSTRAAVCLSRCSVRQAADWSTVRRSARCVCDSPAWSSSPMIQLNSYCIVVVMCQLRRNRRQFCGAVFIAISCERARACCWY